MPNQMNKYGPLECQDDAKLWIKWDPQGGGTGEPDRVDLELFLPSSATANCFTLINPIFDLLENPISFLRCATCLSRHLPRIACNKQMKIRSQKKIRNAGVIGEDI